MLNLTMTEHDTIYVMASYQLRHSIIISSYFKAGAFLNSLLIHIRVIAHTNDPYRETEL